MVPSRAQITTIIKTLHIFEICAAGENPFTPYKERNQRMSLNYLVTQIIIVRIIQTLLRSGLSKSTKLLRPICIKLGSHPEMDPTMADRRSHSESST